MIATMEITNFVCVLYKQLSEIKIALCHLLPMQLRDP